MNQEKREQLIKYIKHYDNCLPWNTDREEINLLKESVVCLLEENNEMKININFLIKEYDLIMNKISKENKNERLL